MEGSHFKYVIDSPDDDIVTRTGVVVKYDQIGGDYWIQWDNGKLLREDLNQLRKTHPSMVFEKPSDSFVPTAETCELLKFKNLNKRAAAERRVRSESRFGWWGCRRRGLACALVCAHATHRG